MRSSIGCMVFAFVIVTWGQVGYGQNFERYRPKTLNNIPPTQTVPKSELPQPTGSERVLVSSLDAILFVDNKSKVKKDESFADLTGVHYDVDEATAIVRSKAIQQVAESYLGQEISLRKLNHLSRDLIQQFRKLGYPVVDVVIPEQKITGGTVQLIVTESKIGDVRFEGNEYFDDFILQKWVQRTQPGNRIYEKAIANDLFWLSQNPFRRIDVDLRPGSEEGTTDVIFEVEDVRPVNAYFGYEDTGVRALKLERFYGGLILGNFSGNDDTLSYQYTADADFRHLHAHAISYNRPMSRLWSFQNYASWAGVDPKLGGGLSQRGESWQVGAGLTRHLVKNIHLDKSLSFGIDFKSTNNNLEFGGVNVANSDADLIQLRFGYRHLRRCQDDQYRLFSFETFLGPGSGFTSNNNTTAFNTIRQGTSPDYIYARAKWEQLWNVGDSWQLVARAQGQLSSERLLFSETIGLGGYDSVRGYDQRTLSGDHGWITNFEFGPKPWETCYGGRQHTVQVYGLVDAGGVYIDNPLPGEFDNQFLVSSGAGVRWSINNRTNIRLDYAYGFDDVVGAAANDRIHLGIVSIIGPRPSRR